MEIITIARKKKITLPTLKKTLQGLEKEKKLIELTLQDTHQTWLILEA